MLAAIERQNEVNITNERREEKKWIEVTNTRRDNAKHTQDTQSICYAYGWAISSDDWGNC